MKQRIAIIFGGNSVEHEISILSLIQASHAINYQKYDILPVYVTKDCRFWVGPNFTDLKTFQKKKFRHYEVVFYNCNKQLFIKGLGYLPRRYQKAIDVVLPIVHGKNVEDGSLAGYFNILNAAFASCSVLEAALFQNKNYTKKALNLVGIKTLPSYSFRYNSFRGNRHLIIKDCELMDYPLIVKPVSLGSSIGIKIAENREDLINAILYASNYDDEIIVEKKLTNFREFNQALLEREQDYLFSEIEEVKSENNYLTFSDKYLPISSSRTIPANIEKPLQDEINRISTKISSSFRIKGVSRVDYLYDLEAKDLFVNEINTIPGSLAFYLFEDKISFTELIDQLIKSALRNKYREGLKVNSFNSQVLRTNRILKK